MARRGPAPKRTIDPDPVYRSVLVSQVVNKVLQDGKKETAREIVYGIMTKKQAREFDETLECQFAIALGEEVRFRVSAFYQQGQVGMVCRRI